MRQKNLSSRFLLGALLWFWATIALGAESYNDECASQQDLLGQVVCYANAAKTVNDLAPCDQAVHEGVRYQCYAIFAEHAVSAEVCRQIPSKSEQHRSLIDVCLSDVALKAGNPDICESILTPGLRDSCYFKLAKKSGNQSLCEKITDKGIKSACTGKPVMIE